MPAADVRYPMPLTRQNPWMPGQFGVEGAWTETGLRMHCTGAVFYVDPNHVDANDQRDGTDPTSPLATVATALTKCQAFRGDVIAVMANDYWGYGSGASYALPIEESVTVTVPGVRIVGVSPSGALGVYWRPAAADGICITVHAMDVTVEGFGFLGRTGGTGVYAVYGGAPDGYGDNLTVRHCFFDEDLDEGIILDYSWYADIHHNVFDECTYGLYTDAATMGDPAYDRIHHNEFHNCGTGAIQLPGADRCDIYENHVYNNAAASLAPAVDSMIDLATGSRNLVHRNMLSCILGAAVVNWDYGACNKSGAGDAWCHNLLMDGVSVTNP